MPQKQRKRTYSDLTRTAPSYLGQGSNFDHHLAQTQLPSTPQHQPSTSQTPLPTANQRKESRPNHLAVGGPSSSLLDLYGRLPLRRITTKSLRVIAGTAQRAVLGGCLLKGGTRPYRSSLLALDESCPSNPSIAQTNDALAKANLRQTKP